MELHRVQIVDDFVRIVPGQEELRFLSTKRTYSGPLEVTVIARTEKDNLRLNAFGSATVIFNWEVRPGELRIHRPPELSGRSGEIAVSKFAPLAPSVWHTIRWQLTEAGMSLFVDGAEIFKESCAYDLSKERAVSVVARNSVVEVKSFTVKQLGPE